MNELVCLVHNLLATSSERFHWRDRNTRSGINQRLHQIDPVAIRHLPKDDKSTR